MNVNQIIVDIMVVFMVLAAVDRCLGCPLDLGDKMDEALSAMGPMCIPMVGMFLMAPLLGQFLSPLVSPLFQFFDADPAMFPNAILACDMGGYALARSMALTPESARLSGCILGCSLGGAISFIIPVGIAMIRKDYHSYFAVGVLMGIVTVPLGLLVGGLSAGFSPSLVFRNTLPILVFSLLIALGLWKAQRLCIKIFHVFGRLLTIVATAGFAIGIIQELTPLTIVHGMPSVLEGIQVVGNVTIVLCGAYPMLHLLSKALNKYIQRLGHIMGIDSNAITGMLGGLANTMPVLGACNRMSPAGLVVAMAFAVSGSCIFGDHLAFVASVDKSMIMPMILSKFVGSISAVIGAVLLCRRNHYPGEDNDQK